jgi:hypothetical protein
VELGCEAIQDETKQNLRYEKMKGGLLIKRTKGKKETVIEASFKLKYFLIHVAFR